MTPVKIDGTEAGWQKSVENVVFEGREADLTHYESQRRKTCERIAGFMCMELIVDEVRRIASFRRTALTPL
jgi:hypothetical protein